MTSFWRGYNSKTECWQKSQNLSHLRQLNVSVDQRTSLYKKVFSITHLWVFWMPIWCIKYKPLLNMSATNSGRRIIKKQKATGQGTFTWRKFLFYTKSWPLKVLTTHWFSFVYQHIDRVYLEKLRYFQCQILLRRGKLL